MDGGKWKLETLLCRVFFCEKVRKKVEEENVCHDDVMFPPFLIGPTLLTKDTRTTNNPCDK
jgi:hypothetical protein